MDSGSTAADRKINKYYSLTKRNKMKTMLFIALLWTLVNAQVFEQHISKNRILIDDGKRVIVQTNYFKEKDKETVGSQKEFGPFDAEFFKYVKEKPTLNEKEIARLLKHQEQKVLLWCKKHQDDFGVLTAKDTCKGEALAWPIEKLSNKQIDDLVAGIFQQSNIKCYLWDLSESTVSANKDKNK